MSGEPDVNEAGGRNRLASLLRQRGEQERLDAAQAQGRMTQDGS